MSSKPLKGICVLELGHSLAAPYAGLIFAELGAEVIKVELPPKGDHARGWGPPFTEDAATAFQVMNRGKYGITCDLSDERQFAHLMKLVRDKADVLVHNLKPGAEEKLGLTGERLLKENPRLVVCNIAAFGAKGPLRYQPGYDPLMQAFSGLMSLCGHPDSPPSRVPVSLVDLGSGMWAAIGILAALRERDFTGKGAVVNTSLLETALNWLTLAISGYLANGEVPQRQGSGLAEIVPYQVFAAQDGEMMVAAGNDGLFKKLCEVMGLNHLVEDPRFSTNPQRVRNKPALIPILQAEFLKKPRAEWLDSLTRVGVPVGPLQTVDEVVRHPQVEALEILQKHHRGGFQTVGLPLSFDGARPSFSDIGPRLGEHNSLFGENTTGSAPDEKK